jgi:hypothetical protein
MISRAISLREALLADFEQQLPALRLPVRARDSEARFLRTTAIWTKRDLAHGCVFASRVHYQHKQWPEAMAALARATGIYRKLVEQNPSMRQFVGELGNALRSAADVAEQSGDDAAALARRQEVVSYWRDRLPAYDLDLAQSLADLASQLLARGKFAEAESATRECLTIREKKMPDEWVTFNTRSRLGGSLLAQKKYAEAEPLLLSGYEGLKQRENQIPANSKVCLKEAGQRLAQLYEANGQTEKAAEWRKKFAESTAAQ